MIYGDCLQELMAVAHVLFFNLIILADRKISSDGSILVTMYFVYLMADLDNKLTLLLIQQTVYVLNDLPASVVY